jgi:hypothetical protein
MPPLSFALFAFAAGDSDAIALLLGGSAVSDDAVLSRHRLSASAGQSVGLSYCHPPLSVIQPASLCVRFDDAAQKK